MDITIHSTFLPHNDAEAAIAFYRDVLGFEVRNDVGYQDMRWITVGPVGQPETNIVLSPPAVDPGITDAERQTIIEMMAEIGVSAASTVPTWAPSRITVTRSEIWRISSILWLI